jgi:N-acetylneuraminate synthase
MKISDVIAAGRAYPPVRTPYVIAEVGVNHEGSMETARRLIDLAAEGGADAVKFQTYRAETLASRDSPAYWDTTKEPTKSQFELFSRHDSFWKSEFEQLKVHCDGSGVEFLSTPFDVESARFLDALMPAFKISSSDLTISPFVDLIAGMGKPVLLSTGASTLAEIMETVAIIRAHGVELALMHCILNYPTADADANLGMIPDLARRFPDTTIGYSDHTLPNADMDVLTTAWLLGATVLEKHFTHDKTLPGNDHYHAMDVEDLRTFRAAVHRHESLLGSFEKGPIPSEGVARRNARRSLVAQVDLEAGRPITRGDLTWKRPATGISPRDMELVIGRRPRHRIPADTVLDWSLLEAE